MAVFGGSKLLAFLMVEAALEISPTYTLKEIESRLN